MKALLLISFFLCYKISYSQTWNLIFSTDSTYIDYFLNGPHHKPTYYGRYRCDTCASKSGVLVAELVNNSWNTLLSYNSNNTTFNLISGVILNYLNQDSIIAYNNNSFHRSFNRGKTWSQFLVDTVINWPLFINTSKSRAICLSDDILIFENGGNTFRRIIPDNNSKYLVNLNMPSQISYLGKSIYWIRRYPIRSNTDTTSLDLLHSSNNGETWTTIPIPVQFKPWDYSNICIAQNKENEGYISITGPIGNNPLSQYDYLMRFKGDSVYSQDHIIIDSFAKNNWLAITGMHFYNNCEGVITTFSEFHYKTADGGNTWHRSSGAPALQFRIADFSDSTCVLYDGGFASAQQKTPLIVNFTNGGSPYPTQSGCVVKPPAGVVKNSQAQVYIYPNPFSEFVNVELPRSEQPFTIAVYTITGQLLVNESLPAGKSVLNTAGFPNGMYVVHVFNSQTLYTIKLIK